MKRQNHASKMFFPEFVCLMAMMISTVALSIDSILPALSDIRQDLAIKNPNDVQFIVSALFFGLMIGQLLVGLLSDRFGRRPILHIGFSIFVIGSLMSLFAQTFEVMLIGRVLQGFGAAAPRIVSIAIVRDQYVGKEMASIMSIIMAIFILVPAIAPAIGQGILFIGTWRSIFSVLLVFSLIVWLWFSFRQEETLTVENRRTLSASKIQSGLAVFFFNKKAFGYTLSVGIIFGAFLAYLNLSQQIFQQTYKTGDYFSLWFGVAALAIGAASILNSKLVLRFGMRPLILISLVITVIISAIFLYFSATMNGAPPFSWLMAWLIISFACLGLMFGNLNALAMEPLGELAGLGAALVGSVSTLVSLPIGWFIAHSYDGGMSSLAAGFTILAFAAFLVVYFLDAGKK